MTSENPTEDRISDSLLKKVKRGRALDWISVRCPLCKDDLEPLTLETNSNGCQTVWWICKRTLAEKCTFPRDIPPEIFWVERTPEEIKKGLTPRPQLDKLPEKYRYLYPTLFPDSGRSTPQESRPHSSLSRMDSAVSLASNRTLKSSDITGDSEVSPVDNRRRDTVLLSDQELSLRDPSGTTDSSVNSSEANENTSMTVAQVPTVKHSTARKRPAPTTVKYPRRSTFDVLKNEAERRHAEGKDEEFRQMLENVRQRTGTCNSPERKRNRMSYHSAGVYGDGFIYAVPQVSFQEVRKAIKEKPQSERLGLAYSMKHAKDGAEFRKALGINDPPTIPPLAPYPKREPSDMKIKEFYVAIEKMKKMKEKKGSRAGSSISGDSTNTSDQPSTSKTEEEIRSEKKKLEHAELSRKTAKLVKEKRAELERSRAASRNSNVSLDNRVMNTHTPPIVSQAGDLIPSYQPSQFTYPTYNNSMEYQQHAYPVGYQHPDSHGPPMYDGFHGVHDLPSSSTENHNEDSYLQDLFDFHEPLFH